MTNPTELQYHLICQWADHYRIPVPLILAICERESSFNSCKSGGAGEQGLMQVLKDGAFAEMVPQFEDHYTFSQLAEDDSICLKFGCGYLRHLIVHYMRGGVGDFGEMTMLIIAYNAGPSQAIRKPSPPQSSITHAYKIMTRYAFWSEWHNRQTTRRLAAEERARHGRG